MRSSLLVFGRTILFGLSILLISSSLYSQDNYIHSPIFNKNWIKPVPPVQIINNLYFVGTYDLGMFLLTTDDGHILVNTGPYGSVPRIKSSIEQIGFDFNDIKILLTTQAHWDHVGGLGEIKRLTGAQMYAHEDDAAALEDGGVSDYKYPNGRQPVFEPIKVDRQLRDGDFIELGGFRLMVHHHPGHTKGAASYSFTTTLDGETYSVMIVNMGTINSGVSVTGMPAYENIEDDFRETFISQLELSPDIYVSAHTNHFDFHEKYSPGDPYDPKRFIDPDGYQGKIKYYQNLYLEKLQEEQAQQSQE